jgi:hypothetical protein
MCRLSRNSGSLKLLEPKGPVQPCNEVTLLVTIFIWQRNSWNYPSPSVPMELYLSSPLYAFMACIWSTLLVLRSSSVSTVAMFESQPPDLLPLKRNVLAEKKRANRSARDDIKVYRVGMCIVICILTAQCRRFSKYVSTLCCRIFFYSLSRRNNVTSLVFSIFLHINGSSKMVVQFALRPSLVSLLLEE